MHISVTVINSDSYNHLYAQRQEVTSNTVKNTEKSISGRFPQGPGGLFKKQDAWRKMYWSKILRQPMHVDTAHALVTAAVPTGWV